MRQGFAEPVVGLIFCFMEKPIRLGTALLVALGIWMGGASGCVVRERRVVASAPPPPCRGGVYVEGHYGHRGRWHPAHWRCPGVIEEVEID